MRVMYTAAQAEMLVLAARTVPSNLVGVFLTRVAVWCGHYVDCTGDVSDHVLLSSIRVALHDVAGGEP